MKPTSTLRSFLLTAGSSLLAIFHLHAASATWNGTTDSSWATTTNWSASPVPGVGNTATFNNAGNGNTTITVGTISLTQVLFDTASAAAYTLGGGTITFANGTTTAVSVTSTVTTNQTINANLTLGTAIASNTTFSNASTTGLLTLGGNITGGTGGTAAAKTLTFTGAGNITVLGNISAGGATSLALDKRGAGTLTLSGATNSITGGDFAIGFAGGNGGTVRIASGASVTTATASRLLLGLNTGQSGTLTMDAGAGTVTFGGNRGSAANYIGVDGGTGTVNANGGTLNFTGMANGSGHVLIGANGGTSNGTMTVAGGTVNVGTRIQMGSGYPGDAAAGWVANGNGNATLTISSGAMNIGTAAAGDTDTDKGFLYLKSPTGGTGTATVNLNGGTLSLAKFMIGAGGTSRVVNFNGGTVQARASRTDFLGTGATLNVKDNGAVIDTNSFNITIAGNLVNSGAGGLTKLNTGTLTLTGANTYTGQTAINGGNLIISGTGVIANNAGNTITIGNGGTLTMSRNDTWGASGAGNPVIPIVISAGGTMTTGGSSFNTLGPLTLNGGTLTTTGGANAQFPSWAMRGTVTVGGLVASTISGGSGSHNMINLGANSVTGTTFTVADAAAGSAVDLTVSAVLQNGSDFFNVVQASSLLKNGAGTMTLTNTNTYTGATTVAAGVLALGATGSINNTSGVALGGGTFDVSAKTGGYTVNNLTGVGNVIGALTVSTSLAIGTSPGTINFESLSLGAASTFTYDLTGGASTADLGNVSATLTIGTSAVLDLVQLGTYTLDDKFTLFGYATGNLTGTFAGLSDGSEFTDAGGLWKINYFDTTAGLNGGTGTSFVTLTAIPEPSAALLGGLGLLALLRRRRS